MTSIPATKSDTADPAHSGRSRATKVRWAVAVFCAFGLAINYIDRSAISVSLPFMTQDFHLTPTEKGLILSAFSWSYALMQIPAGRLIDRFGERVMFGASVLVWSLFTAATAGVSSFARAPRPAPRAGRRRSRRVPRGRQNRVAVVPAAAAWPGHLGLRQRCPHRQRRGNTDHRAHHRPVGLASGVHLRRRTRHAVGDRLVGLVPAAGDQGRGQRGRTGDHPREPPRAEFQQPEPGRQADAHRRTVQAAHRVGHDARILLPELHDHLLPHLVPLVPGRGARLQPAQARCLRHDPAAGGHPGQLGRRPDRRLSAQAGLVTEQGPQDLPRRRHAGLLGDRAGRHRTRGLAGARADVDLLCGGGVHHRLHLVPARRRRRLQHGRQPRLHAELLLQHRQRTEPDHHRGALRCDRLVRRCHCCSPR